MNAPATPRPKRLDERVAPGWANICSNLLRGGGIAVVAVLLWLGFLTGGFFLVLTGVLAAVALVGGWLLGGFVIDESWYERPNARLLSILLVIWFPIALIAFAQVVGPVLTPAPNTLACFSGTLARDEQKQEPLAVDPRITSMQFEISVLTLEGGALRWWATDPFGQVQWGGRAEAPGFSDQQQVAPVGGQWSLTLLSEAEQATYRIEWKGQTAGPNSGLSPSPCLGGNL